MKIVHIKLWILMSCILGCNENNTKKPLNALETGRKFIRTSLNGQFEEAHELLLPDITNEQFFESYKTYYNRLSGDDKQKYKDASYEINKLLELNDSTTIINYSNSYMHKAMEIKVVKKNNAWWVDFTYTASGNLPIE